MKAKKMIAILASAACIAASAMPAMAADYTAVAGGTTTFKKYLVMDADAHVPNATFSYTIAPGTAIPADATHMAVLAGKTGAVIRNADAPTGSTADSGIVGFTPAGDDAGKATAVATGDTLTLDTGEAYVKKNVTIDFSECSFTEPGIYRYVVTEATGDSRIAYDTQNTGGTANVRYLDVYVTDNNGTLQVSSYAMHKVANQPLKTTDAGSANAAQLEDKSDGYVNEYATQDLEFGKEVTGNQGSKDKYFDFTLVIGNAGDAQQYTVDISKAIATSGTNEATIAANRSKANVTSITTDAEGAATTHFYLQDGQYITVRGLPKGATYALTENAEDYKSTAGITAANATSHSHDGGTAAAVAHSAATNGTIANTITTTGNDPILTGYTNTRDGVVPTGVALAVLPGVAAIAIGAGLIGMASKKKKEQ